MPKKPVISNTSPLIALWGLNRLSLLRDLYTEVWIPRMVEKEFLAIDETIYREVLDSAPWIKIMDLTHPQSAAIYQGLDAGETEVLALAEEHDARLAIIDEHDARQEAKKIGLPFKGVVGVLLEAKEEGLIDEIKPLLIALKQNGIYLGESVIADALREAGEV